MIGWDGFSMGMVTREFYQVQSWHLALSSSSLSPHRWTTSFIKHLLKITHCQWVYRNEVVHHNTMGKNKEREKQTLAEQIQAELELGVVDLLPEDWRLMEVQLEDLTDSSGESHTYWLLAVETAQIVGQMSSLPQTGID